MTRNPKGLGDVTGSVEMSAMERSAPDEVLAILEDREILRPEVKAVIARLVRDELEELIRRICREELSTLLKKLRERMGKRNARAKTDGNTSQVAEPKSPIIPGSETEPAQVVEEQEAQVSLSESPNEPPREPVHTHYIDPDTGEPVCSPDDLSGPAVPKGTRLCLCCGSGFTLPEKGGHNQKHCGSCDFPMRIKRNQAIVHALWIQFPEIAEQIVASLKEKGEWPNG